jgi:Lipocalin-like domain
MRLLRICVLSVAVASVLCPLGIAAQQPARASERQTLVGVWELVSLQDHRPNGEVLDWMGTKPSGALIYSPDGHMSVQIMRDPHPVVAASMWSSDGRDLLPSASARDSGCVRWLLRLLRHVGHRRGCAYGDASHSRQHACSGSRRGLRPAVRVLWGTPSASLHRQSGQRRKTDPGDHLATCRAFLVNLNEGTDHLDERRVRSPRQMFWRGRPSGNSSLTITRCDHVYARWTTP